MATRKRAARRSPAEAVSPKSGPARAKRARRSGGAVVAVTGAFGFLGRHLLRRLEGDPAVDRVVAVDVRSGAALLDDDTVAADLMTRHPKLSAHILDLTAPGADRELAGILAAEQVTSLFHLAFLSSPTHHLEMAHELETVGTHYVLNAAAAAAVDHVLSVSSTMCYGARPDNPAYLTEDAPLRPPPSRALRDRADADEQVRRFAAEHDDVAVVVARLGALLPTARDHFWTRLLSRPLVPTVLGYDPLLQFLHPDDAIAALLHLWRTSARGVFNVVGQGVLPLSHVLTRLRRLPLLLPAGLGQSLAATLWRAQLVEMPQHFFGYLRWGWLADDARLRATGFVPQHDLPTLLTILERAPPVRAGRDERPDVHAPAVHAPAVPSGGPTPPETP
ncbi:MAG: NAD-dependent epimerase/dehydratase family protein [Deltaproteobacteria bacterium]|nr:NAD-dependent epimerase/dehydratase family protein [Deltaproteobacteria bacterium]